MAAALRVETNCRRDKPKWRLARPEWETARPPWLVGRPLWESAGSLILGLGSWERSLRLSFLGLARPNGRVGQSVACDQLPATFSAEHLAPDRRTGRGRSPSTTAHQDFDFLAKRGRLPPRMAATTANSNQTLPKPISPSPIRLARSASQARCELG
jgi:hypothetical protein